MPRVEQFAPHLTPRRSRPPRTRQPRIPRTTYRPPPPRQVRGPVDFEAQMRARYGARQRAAQRASYRRYAAQLLAQQPRVVIRHPTWKRPGLVREHGQYYDTHLKLNPYTGQTYVHTERPQHDLLAGAVKLVGHGLAHAGGDIWRATGGNLQAQGFAAAGGHGSQEEVNRQLRRTRRAAAGINEFVAPAFMKPIEGKGVGFWDVANTALWFGGPLRGLGALGEGGVATARFLHEARAAEAIGDTKRAARLFQLAHATRAGGAEAARAWRANEGLIRPILGRVPALTPRGRAFLRIPAVRERYAKIEADLRAGKINRFQAADRRKAIREALINPSKLAGQGPMGLARRLEPQREEGLAPELHPNALYQGKPPTLSGSETLPARLRIKGLKPSVYNLIKRGAEYRDWYRRGAVVIDDFATRLGLSSKQAAGIVAVTSQGANPTFNLKRAAEAVQAVKAGQDISHTMLGGQFAKVKHIIENPDTFDWSGVKTNNYFANFYRQLDPQGYAAMYGEDARHATIDRHMAAMFLGKQTVTDKQYEAIKDVMFRTADSLGWSPEEVQAAAWVPWKAQQMGVTQEVKRFLREAEKAGQVPPELQIPDRLRGKKLTPETKKLHAARAAWAREQLSGSLPPGWERHLPTAADAYERGQALYRAPEGEHPGGGDWLYQHEKGRAPGHTFDSSVAQVHSEIRPDETFWPERAAMFDRMSPEEQIHYARLTDQA